MLIDKIDFVYYCYFLRPAAAKKFVDEGITTIDGLSNYSVLIYSFAYALLYMVVWK